MPSPLTMLSERAALRYLGAMLPLQLAAVVAVTAGVFVLAVRCRWPVPAALLAAAVAIGALTGVSIDQTLIKGFGEAAGHYGLIIVAAALFSAPLSPPAAAAAARRCREKQRQRAAAWSLLGTAAAASGSAAAALLLLAPLAAAAPPARAGSASPPLAALALSLAAARTLLPPNVGPVAAIVILEVDPAAAILLLLALAAISSMVALAVALAGGGADDAGGAAVGDAGVEAPLLVAATLSLMCAGAVAVSHWQPFGKTAWVQTWGQPVLALLVAAVAAWWLAHRRRPRLFVPQQRLSCALGGAGRLLLLVGAAGAFAKMLQDLGVAEAAAEAMLGQGGGVLLMFFTAAAIKTLQGSSWVATLMSAGLLHAMPGGLADDSARLLAVGAICAGSAVVSHANDPYFWMAAHALRLSPVAALRLVSVGSLLQGGACALALLLLEAWR